MKNVIFVWFLLVAQCIYKADATTQQQCQTSSIGRNFVFGVIGYQIASSSTNLRLHITPVIQEKAQVRVTAPFINMDRTYTVTNYTVVTLNGTLIQFENGTQFKGIEVSSDVNISVTVVTGSADLTEGFLVLPVNALGTRYVAASYTVYGTYSSEILITGVERDTDVTLKTITKGHISSSTSFRLQKFETYQFKSASDISGSIITSNKPVAVVSGSAIAQVPAGIGDYQYLVEQMIPTKYWTTQFIIPSIYPRKYFVLRLFADQDNTEVHYYNSTKHFAVYMDKGSMEEILFGTDPVVISANNPISVIQYGHDGDNMNGDPFMSNSQGTSQYKASYNFVTQNFISGGSNTIAITILKNNTSGLLLNGHTMSYWSAKNVTVSPPMDQYITLFVNVSYNSYYYLRYSGGETFGAVIYGRFSTGGQAYGYPLQLTLTANDCESHVSLPNISNSTVASYTTSSFRYSTTKAQMGKGTWCFQCEGMDHLKYCDKVSKCKNENEVCYVQRFTRSLDVVLFKSGCTHQRECNTSDVNGHCFKCCDGDFCNSAGCGDDGFSAPRQRGPICFDCTHKGGDGECTTVQLCHSNQVCMVEKYEWGDSDHHYIRSCAEPQMCSKKRSTSDIAARHAPVCSYCCNSDFCNLNCTSVHTAPAIVG